MIVNDFDVKGVQAGPVEADAELVIDPDRVLSFSIASERFQAIAGNSGKIRQSSGGMEMVELSFCHGCDALEPFAELATEYPFRFSVPEGPNHL